MENWKWGLGRVELKADDFEFLAEDGWFDYRQRMTPKDWQTYVVNDFALNSVIPQMIAGWKIVGKADDETFEVEFTEEAVHELPYPIFEVMQETIARDPLVIASLPRGLNGFPGWDSSTTENSTQTPSEPQSGESVGT